MTLKERLAADLKEAMKEKDNLRKNVVTMIRSDIKQVEVDKRVELNDEEIIDIITRQVKQRKDALEEFTRGGREDLVAQTQDELKILMTYLPEQLSEEEIAKIVSETVKELNATSIKEMGKVMAALMPKLKGRADGKLVNQFVKEHLQN
ncbi:GatB/YqeY domain-containing protein [Alkaliphilus serpentinus]|uniref:GatB/YqeY domain-containing protein n=1 Tax=Alkaliphilus serpentinus TaxID=1482731 RepID=A0A833MEC5_9FIRM|nr:GatB/YqeY domain-containing protein [Alkaliphilus serpentinus]KAB3530759.1 GatB/YqeY domain-containing protein [Alkaliphilus serpentinus]